MNGQDTPGEIVRMKLTDNFISERLKQLPKNPGVYLMKEGRGNILYVGKATSLYHRVRSYFGTQQKLSPKIQRMVSRIADIDFFITTSEQEALILELNLIKRHRPYYNVLLKDDKSFPYLKIDPSEDWPRIHVTRRLEQDGGHYFGPFASARSLRQTMKLLKKIFPFRSCSKAITGIDRRSCLEYYIGHCLAPCTGAVSRREYYQVIKEVILFLEGKQDRVLRELKSNMKKAAQALDFEKAALLRDQIQAANSVIEGQRIATTIRGEQDVIAFAQDKDQACVQVFFIRNNMLIGRESFILQRTLYEEPHQIMTNFIKQFYNSSPYIPPLLLLQNSVEDQTVIEDWLQSKRGSQVRLEVPIRGHKKQLINNVAENAKQGMEQLKAKQLASSKELDNALAQIKHELRLPKLPLRMEGYDISNIQGRAAVGSMVIFDRGKPKPAHYRRFRIKTVSGANDYAMLQEVLKRRFKRTAAASNTWAILPDLVLIDGGKGQLKAVRTTMVEIGAEAVHTVSLAKENEEIFVPGTTEPIILDRGSPGLKLLQHLRDEAHRFALGYHQKIRRQETFASALDTIPNIGPKRKRALLRQFGSIQAIKKATEEELATTSGITRSLANKVKEYL
jgi:excinuclease ABC subunit C